MIKKRIIDQKYKKNTPLSFRVKRNFSENIREICFPLQFEKNPSNWIKNVNLWEISQFDQEIHINNPETSSFPLRFFPISFLLISWFFSILFKILYSSQSPACASNPNFLLSILLSFWFSPLDTRGNTIRIEARVVGSWNQLSVLFFFWFN